MTTKGLATGRKTAKTVDGGDLPEPILGAGDEGAGVLDGSEGNQGSGDLEGALIGDVGTGILEGGDLADEVEVLISNNSVGGHEILRANGKVLSIAGHCKGLSIKTTKEELVAIQLALVDKPWVEITLKPESE
ncbi:TPA: hypothetical protein ACMDRZ_003055 [Vibrio cholerae]|uniref:hypothetical protein n=1 Tax=Vibrio cholerae TaxID=666 RepID=UPI001583888E|nr:hypothetical protein [Vibrio cholerae]QKU65654.1 hypothetical protein HPY17_20265 [Vibrio cholerae]QKU69458.1 hypothetical protein HPY10_19915 [Vibrio cholerae]